MCRVSIICPRQEALADMRRITGVLDPSDENHNFIGQRETLRPVSMFRHPDGCIMLCYNGKLAQDSIKLKLLIWRECLEIAFYIDKKGRRIRSDWIINWEGHPTAFAFRYPYIVAFDSSFIEIRHVNTVSASLRSRKQKDIFDSSCIPTRET